MPSQNMLLSLVEVSGTEDHLQDAQRLSDEHHAD
jgi:hypothetical protein